MTADDGEGVSCGFGVAAGIFSLSFVPEKVNDTVRDLYGVYCPALNLPDGGVMNSVVRIAIMDPGACSTIKVHIEAFIILLGCRYDCSDHSLPAAG